MRAGARATATYLLPPAALRGVAGLRAGAAFAAAFFAGMLNTVAGGGTFLTFPALVYTGIPVVAANATAKPTA